jgi:hypothetical protein
MLRGGRREPPQGALLETCRKIAAERGVVGGADVSPIASNPLALFAQSCTATS